ncbi:hypothetical protein [Bifidobacterium myosotis]|uniref:Uncharacterized protein n=1 Tax=Bifidobacterium myosotis TaxID=1630166 RepID=A0A5M9ZMM4_9BIFI|nr:hypothetical protein [Bifidobacterium myosotis]KAA8828122.1 hypothetical protein EMO91_06690 [Bifidobacterium myosotis]
MRIHELIDTLRGIEADYGDIPVVLENDDPNWRDALDYIIVATGRAGDPEARPDPDGTGGTVPVAVIGR